MTSDLDIWHAPSLGTLCRSSLKVEVMGQNSRSRDANVFLFGFGSCTFRTSGVTYFRYARFQGGRGEPGARLPFFGRENIFTARRYASAVYAVVQCLIVSLFV